MHTNLVLYHKEKQCLQINYNIKNPEIKWIFVRQLLELRNVILRQSIVQNVLRVCAKVKGACELGALSRLCEKGVIPPV